MEQAVTEIFGMKIKLVEGNSCANCVFNDKYSDCPSFKGQPPCGNSAGYFVEEE